MNLAVKFYGVNSLGIPVEWPMETYEIPTGSVAPSGWTTMTDVELVAYKALHQGAFDSSRDADAQEVKAARAKRFVEIDDNTDRLIALGMSFSGTIFSLSGNAREKMNNIDGIRNDPALSYPVIWNNIDDSATVTLVDAAAVHAMYLTALGTVRAHIDSGTAVKDLVRAATTVSAVLAVQDNR